MDPGLWTGELKGSPSPGHLKLEQVELVDWTGSSLL